jgi:hypothetical protein
MLKAYRRSVRLAVYLTVLVISGSWTVTWTLAEPFPALVLPGFRGAPVDDQGRYCFVRSYIVLTRNDGSRQALTLKDLPSSQWSAVMRQMHLLTGRDKLHNRVPGFLAFFARARRISSQTRRESIRSWLRSRTGNSNVSIQSIRRTLYFGPTTAPPVAYCQDTFTEVPLW